ncbi:uncharacterized protein LOC143493076 isoform X2 [Brachyhypopomus gauderio]|uniref:uncharacterized protein LOC143493076 isoform X2 n=1 Tax=Brachyhypopomus gauderio TaxID=698409 RepID=UPI0040422D02
MEQQKRQKGGAEKLRAKEFLVLLLSITILSLAKPLADTDTCAGIQENNHVIHKLPDYIIKAMQDPSCDSHWSINDMVVATNMDGNIDKDYPVISATNTSITMDTCETTLSFHITCVTSDYTKTLQCPCKSSTIPVPNIGPYNYALSLAAYKWLAIVIIICRFIF